MLNKAKTSYEASRLLLEPIWRIDYKSNPHRVGIIIFEYVYFDPVHCRYFFSDTQIGGQEKYLVKRYGMKDKYNAVEIVACKYPFAKLVLGAIVYRKLMGYREFFELVREKPELF